MCLYDGVFKEPQKDGCYNGGYCLKMVICHLQKKPPAEQGRMKSKDGLNARLFSPSSF